MNRIRKKPEISWIAKNKYWLEHPEEENENIKLGLEYVRYMKDNNLTEEETADHFNISLEEFHKIIHGQIPPKNLEK